MKKNEFALTYEAARREQKAGNWLDAKLLFQKALTMAKTCFAIGTIKFHIAYCEAKLRRPWGPWRLTNFS